jgi:hypothetical protein
MQNVWALASLWVGLALIATLLAIWFKISTALEEVHRAIWSKTLVRRVRTASNNLHRYFGVFASSSREYLAFHNSLFIQAPVVELLYADEYT